MSGSSSTIKPASRPSDRPALPPSPCVGICTLKGDTCYGCGRSVEEIAAWGTLSADAQSAVWAELPGRLAAFGFKTFRLAAGAAVVAEFMGRTFRETTGSWRLVSPWLEGSILIAADQRPSILETSCDVTATTADGNKLQLLKHDKVRIFGFSSRDDAPAMDTVALVLPKGRAQRDIQDISDTLPTSKAVALQPPDMFSRVSLIPNLDAVGALPANGLSLTELGLLPWTEAARHLTNEAGSGNWRVGLRNALGQIETSKPQFAVSPPPPDANAPADLKISKAFVACAVFKADDPAWLAAALAP